MYIYIARNTQFDRIFLLGKSPLSGKTAGPDGSLFPFSWVLQSLSRGRWLKTIASVSVCYVHFDRPELYMFRRMQLAEQAALKQARNPLQKTLIFHARAVALQDWGRKITSLNVLFMTIFDRIFQVGKY